MISHSLKIALWLQMAVILDPPSWIFLDKFWSSRRKENDEDNFLVMYFLWFNFILGLNKIQAKDKI